MAPHIIVHGELSRWMVGIGELYYTDGDQERVREIKRIGQQRRREREKENGCVREKVGSPWDILDLNK